MKKKDSEGGRRKSERGKRNKRKKNQKERKRKNKRTSKGSRRKKTARKSRRRTRATPPTTTTTTTSTDSTPTSEAHGPRQVASAAIDDTGVVTLAPFPSQGVHVHFFANRDTLLSQPSKRSTPATLR